MKLSQLSIDLLQHADKLKLKQENGVQLVKDPCRKKYVKLEPEEFVRQLFILHLHDNLKVGYGRMTTERGIDNYQKNRFDLGVLKPDGTWSLLIECKSFRKSLDEDVIIQLMKYNLELRADIVLMTNGKQTYAWKVGEGEKFITEESELIRQISS